MNIPKDGIFKIRHALLSLYSDKANYVLRGDDYSGLEWNSSDIAKPTEQELLAEIARLQNEYNNEEYKRLRALEYPSIADQFDLLYHGGYDAWKQEIEKIKTKYPKPV